MAGELSVDVLTFVHAETMFSFPSTCYLRWFFWIPDQRRSLLLLTREALLSVGVGLEFVFLFSLAACRFVARVQLAKLKKRV